MTSLTRRARLAVTTTDLAATITITTTTTIIPVVTITTMTISMTMIMNTVIPIKNRNSVRTITTMITPMTIQKTKRRNVPTPIPTIILTITPMTILMTSPAHTHTKQQNALTATPHPNFRLLPRKSNAVRTKRILFISQMSQNP